MMLGPYETPGYYIGDVLDCLRALPDECIYCVVTSPPYFGLRAYAGDQNVVWTCPDLHGAPACEHDWTEKERLTTSGGPPGKTAQVGATVTGVQRGKVLEATCSKCGAWKGGFGAEPTPELYIEHSVEILREIRRVLRPDGVCFWVIGDSYNAAGRQGPGTRVGYKQQTNRASATGQDNCRANTPDLKPKDLLLIPHRVALAAQADGWYVRSDIIWVKGASFGPYVGNPMPESVNDRPTSAHEHIWMFTKSPKYFWDAEAVREPARDWGRHDQSKARRRQPEFATQGQNPHSGLNNHQCAATGRNVRNVWTIPTRPFRGAHFAVFPPELALHLVEVACPAQTCTVCGAPWTPVTGRRCTNCDELIPTQGKQCPLCGHVNDWKTARFDVASDAGQAYKATDYSTPGRGTPRKTGSMGMSKTVVTSYQAVCTCNAPARPGIVLDPFAGSGTTLAVAECLGRDWIGFDISEQYGNLFAARMADVRKWFDKRQGPGNTCPDPAL